MIKVTNVSFSIKGKSLLRNVNVQFEPGHFSLIIGPNGAGKSTLIKALCNQLKLDTGEVHYGGRALSEMKDHEIAKTRAVLSQHTELAFPMKVWEVVLMGRYPHFSGRPTEKDHQYCEEAMKFFNVWEMAERDFMTLSGGEKQRVHFARVAVQIWPDGTHDCKYLLLDEPLTFLDVHHQFQFMHKVGELMQQQSMVVVGVVHDLNLAARFAQHLTLVHQGQILANGTTKTVLTTENIRQAFQIDPVFFTREDGSLYIFFE